MKTRHWGKCAFFLLLFPLLLTGCGGAVASPQNVAVEFGTDHTARVTWDTVEGADGYRVFKKDSDSTDYEYLLSLRCGGKRISRQRPDPWRDLFLSIWQSTLSEFLIKAWLNARYSFFP